jgi:hypothetical protein
MHRLPPPSPSFSQAANSKSNRKLASEDILRQLLDTMSSSASSKPRFDVVSRYRIARRTAESPFALSLLTLDQGVSSLSLANGDTIDLNFTAKKQFADREAVVSYDPSGQGRMTSYTLPYLFQSVDTTVLPYKLAVCTSELVEALRYTDVNGLLGSHPNFPPFPLCVSKTSVSSAKSEPVKGTSRPNPAFASEGYVVTTDSLYDKASWLSNSWIPSISAPVSLIKTTSSGSL